jgi:uncharacterized membrane protein YjdF
MKPRNRALAVTGVLATLAIIVFAFTARVPTYRVAPAFLVPILWAPVLLRRPLHLHPFHYLLFAVAVLLHGTGAYGFYQRAFLGVSFDIYVHFYFAFAGAFLVERFLRWSVHVRPWAVFAMTLMFMMGAGAIHELAEYVSYLVLGEGRGMLKPTTSYQFDTQRDLLNNLLGTLTALLLIAVTRVLSGNTGRADRAHR